MVHSYSLLSFVLFSLRNTYRRNVYQPDCGVQYRDCVRSPVSSVRTPESRDFYSPLPQRRPRSLSGKGGVHSPSPFFLQYIYYSGVDVGQVRVLRSLLIWTDTEVLFTLNRKVNGTRECACERERERYSVTVCVSYNHAQIVEH